MIDILMIVMIFLFSISLVMHIISIIPYYFLRQKLKKTLRSDDVLDQVGDRLFFSFRDYRLFRDQSDQLIGLGLSSADNKVVRLTQCYRFFRFLVLCRLVLDALFCAALGICILYFIWDAL